MVSFHIDTIQVLSAAIIIIALTFPVRVSTFLDLRVAASDLSNYPEIFSTCRRLTRALCGPLVRGSSHGKCNRYPIHIVADCPVCSTPSSRAVSSSIFMSACTPSKIILPASQPNIPSTFRPMLIKYQVPVVSFDLGLIYYIHCNKNLPPSSLRALNTLKLTTSCAKFYGSFTKELISGCLEVVSGNQRKALVNQVLPRGRRPSTTG